MKQTPMVRALPIAAATLLLSLPSTASAQSVTEAVEDVLEWLDEGYELIPEMGQWGLVFGWFAESEEKELRFEVTAGESYMIAGGGDESSEDLDICVFDRYDTEVQCDTLTDNFPIVQFDAKSAGTYRAVLTAYSLSAGTSYAGMAVLRKN